MEYPNLGEHCSVDTCKRLDFLPVKCDACKKIFCSNHMTYTKHNCSSAYQKNVQVPVCPLCNKPVPIQRGTLPDIAVGNHIDNDCKSDQAQERKKVFTNKCSMKGCKIKEIVPVICSECGQNFCFKHRHTVDHSCLGRRQRVLDAAVLRQKQNNIRRSQNPTSFVTSVQGNLTEDEAMARAMQMSLETSRNTTNNSRNQQQNCHIS